MPSLNEKTPAKIKEMVAKAWTVDVEKRPTMNKIYACVKVAATRAALHASRSIA